MDIFYHPIINGQIKLGSTRRIYVTIFIWPFEYEEFSVTIFIFKKSTWDYTRVRTITYQIFDDIFDDSQPIGQWKVFKLAHSSFKTIIERTS